MSNLGFQIVVDKVTPSLARLNSGALRARAVLSGATALMALAQRAFDEPGLRPAAWAPRKKPASHALLILSGDLRQKMTVSASGEEAMVTIGSDYAATHQLGRGGIPARPYFPALDGQLTDEGVAAIDEVVSVLVGDAYKG